MPAKTRREAKTQKISVIEKLESQSKSSQCPYYPAYLRRGCQLLIGGHYQNVEQIIKENVTFDRCLEAFSQWVTLLVQGRHSKEGLLISAASLSQENGCNAPSPQRAQESIQRWFRICTALCRKHRCNEFESAGHLNPRFLFSFL